MNDADGRHITKTVLRNATKSDASFLIVRFSASRKYYIMLSEILCKQYVVFCRAVFIYRPGHAV